MKSNILFILHLPPPVHGAAMVGKSIFESRLISTEFNADYINLATSKELKEGKKGGIKKVFVLMPIIYRLIKALRKKTYDLCYVTLTADGWAFYKDLLIVAVLKLFKRKIIYHFHNKGVAEASKKRINRSLYRFAFKDVSCILLSPYLYEDISEYVSKESVYYCSNGIQDDQLPVMHSVEKTAGDLPAKLLFLSNMMVEKGVLILLDACGLLKQKGVSFECHFVGAWLDISEEDFATAVTRLHLEGQVFAHGARYNEEKDIFFNEADIFVFPTYYETFGLVNLEAMKKGLPIVSTLEGGIPGVVSTGETGFLVEKKNPQALADKIELLIHNPELRVKMGMAGRQRFKKYFTQRTFETNLSDIFKQAIIANKSVNEELPCKRLTAMQRL